MRSRIIMKTAIKTVKYLFLIPWLLLPLSAGAALLPAESPVSVVLDFYRLNLQDSSSDGYDQSVKQYVTLTLQKNISDSISCNYDSDDTDQALCDTPRPCKTTENHSACLWGDNWVENDVNYYTKSQDIYDSWVNYRDAYTESQTDEMATVLVTLGNPPDELLPLRVTVINEKGNWKINNVALIAQ